MSTNYLFVDGAFFESFCRRMIANLQWDDPFLDVIDFDKFRHNYDRIFYYDSLPERAKDQPEEEFKEKEAAKQITLDRLSMIPDLRVHTGMSRYRKKRGLEQKCIDVLLTIEVFQHAILGNMDRATIITSDLDFYPLFEALSKTRVRRLDAGNAHDPRILRRSSPPARRRSQAGCSDAGV